MTNRVIVIGGGIAGIQASLDLAEAGCPVTLVEREPALGGKMAALDKNFPTLDCSICIEAPKIGEVVRHPNIEVLTLADVVGLEGQAGAFRVAIEQRGRFVTSACTRCNDCVTACPQTAPNAFDEGLAARKAIYTPFSQAEPGAYAIDLDACLNDPPNYLACNRCVAACQPNAIDFSQPKTKRVDREAASVIVSTGFRLFDARSIPEYGYGTHPDILNSMEFERLINAAGPTQGEVVRPSDGKHPHNALFVLCVGSRDQRFCHYCSRVCCMYSAKEAYQAKEHGVEAVTVLYMDLRSYGKGFDEFIGRAAQEGVRFVRGRPALIRAHDGALQVRYESTAEAVVHDEPFDLVVLAPALLPSPGTPDLARVLAVELDPDGFFRTGGDHGSLQATTRPGVYVCGAASGPKDIPDSVAEASAAAAEAMTHVDARSWPVAEAVPPLDVSGPAQVGVFLCDCGSNIAGTIRVPALVEFARTLPGVAHAEEMMFACSANAQEKIAQAMKEKGLNRAVVAACSPKTHGSTFQKVCARAGLNPYLFEMANLRNHASWVHKADKGAATTKGRDLLRMSVEKAKLLQPLDPFEQAVVPHALVVGGGPSGMAAAANLARQGFETHLAERAPALGGLVGRLHHLAGIDQPAADLLHRLEHEVKESGVHVHLNAEPAVVSGHVGNFHVQLTDGSGLDVGAVIVATGVHPAPTQAFGLGQDARVLTNLDLERRPEPQVGDRVTFLGCIGSRQGAFGCSRYCCTSMMRQALDLRRRGKHVRVLTKDIRTYTRHGEELFEEAARAGVQFYRLPHEVPVEDHVQWAEGDLEFNDVLSGARLRLPTDSLVLVQGLRPNPPGAVADQLKLSLGEDGFLLESHPKLAPVEAAVSGVYLAGGCQGPKDVAESVAQGAATAAKAAVLLARGKGEREPLRAIIDAEKCTGCTLCAQVCPHSAIDGKVKETHQVISAACQGCGTCAAACPADAITMPGFTDAQVLAQIDAATEENAADKVVVFACNWCSYAGADQAGIAKLQYPPSSRIIRTMCSGRVSEKFVLHALERGAGGVLVTGCHPGSCHYLTANLETEKRVAKWKKRLQHKGIDPRRLELVWISAAEGKRFAQTMTAMHERLHNGATPGTPLPAVEAKRP